ncbi:MAG: hypothetical protein R6U61_09520, partial [Thermoplasmata archaeon]
MNKGRLIVVLLFVLFILSFVPMRAQAESYSYELTTYINGDWIVNTPQTLENQTVILNGNLSIQNGGSLTFKNVTLKMNSSSSIEFYIEVLSGGA